jgi:ferritin-like metal-binding protein YciE
MRHIRRDRNSAPAAALSHIHINANTPEQTMSAKEKTLEDLFYETLKDIYFAEKQILKALPKMAKAVNSDDLRRAFEKHRGETEGHVERLEKVFDLIHRPARAKTCDAILGIVDEGKEIMEEFGDSPALDAGLLAGAQAVEHYEISRYGTLRTWAAELGLNDAARLLDQTLAEEKKTDELLTKLAEGAVNLAAA